MTKLWLHTKAPTNDSHLQGTPPIRMGRPGCELTLPPSIHKFVPNHRLRGEKPPRALSKSDQIAGSSAPCLMHDSQTLPGISFSGEQGSHFNPSVRRSFREICANTYIINFTNSISTRFSIGQSIKNFGKNYVRRRKIEFSLK